MNKNANSADVTRLTKASWKVFSGTFISFLAGLGQKSSVPCMLFCPSRPKTSLNWISKVDN